MGIVNGSPVWFGRSNMTKLNNTLHIYYVSRSSDYEVSSRTVGSSYTGFQYVIPFEITMGEAGKGSGEIKAIASMYYNSLYIHPVGINTTTNEWLYTGSSITGYECVNNDYHTRFTFPSRFTPSEGDLYLYESSDLVVIRLETFNGVTAELWVSKNGWIQYLDSSNLSNKHFEYYKSQRYTIEGNLICGDSGCPYRSGSYSCQYQDSYESQGLPCAFGARKLKLESGKPIFDKTFAQQEPHKILAVLNYWDDCVYYTDKHIEHPLITKTSGAIDIKQSEEPNKHLFLYNEPIHNTDPTNPVYNPTILGVRSGGKKVYAHFVPEDSSPYGFEKVSNIRLRHNGVTMVGANRCSTTFTTQPVFQTIDRFAYVALGRYYWIDTQIYGFYPTLTNVKKVIGYVYVPSGYQNKIYLPNENYPYLYFYASSTYLSGDAYWYWDNESSISIPSPVQGRPHVVEFNFNSPINIAQWTVLPTPRGSSFWVMPSNFSEFTFILEDGKSVNYKF